MHANFGWAEPVGALDTLRTAVRKIVNARGNYRERMTDVTFALAFLKPTDVPPHLRERLERIMDARRQVRVDYVNDALFHFERLPSKRREGLINDIFDLYEACLIDIRRGKTWTEIVYPK